MRAQLNTVHRALDKHHGKDGDKIALEKNISNTSWAPSILAFTEDDPPARDILGARLRSQYWVTQVAAYRPFIGAVLESNYWVR